MPTPIWKGRLAVGDTGFRARLFTGPRDEPLSLQQFHACGSRTGQLVTCKAEGIAIARDQIQRGFEYEKDKHIIITDAELDAITPPRLDEIVLLFVDATIIDPLLIHSTYYVHPDGDDEPLYAELFSALKSLGRAASTMITLGNRQRPFVIRAGSTGLVAHTLFYSHETRALDQFRTHPKAASKALRAVVAKDSGSDPGTSHDYQREVFNDLIRLKIHQAIKEPVTTEPPNQPKTSARKR